MSGQLDVRLVPISAEQVKALESLERALRSLADDFQREVGAGQSMAGGLYRLWSTLDVIQTMWHAARLDPAGYQRWRVLLEKIRDTASQQDRDLVTEDAHRVAR